MELLGLLMTILKFSKKDKEGLKFLRFFFGQSRLGDHIGPLL
jgi:hypothetical protein